MGIDVHALNFLRFGAQHRPLGKMALLGRQEIQVPRAVLDRLLPQCVGHRYGLYAEQLLLDGLGATEIDSLDHSDFEGANRIVDLNRPIAIHDAYDTVFDGGCIEHIYNVPQALLSVSQMCKTGGQILHVLPANQFCGHGFWQMSPELFFSLYSDRNGYRDTAVYVASVYDESHWYEVRRPEGGQRANIMSPAPLHVLVRTVKNGATSHEEVQQSDYVHAWDGGTGISKTKARKLRREKENSSSPGPFAASLHKTNQFVQRLRQIGKRRLGENRSLKRVAIADLLKVR